MKKTKEFMLHVFIVAFDRSEAEQTVSHYGNKNFHKFYEYDHIRRCEGLTWCIVYKVKKLPSIRDLKNAIEESDEQRIINYGTGFE